jgi:hypothetical protein
MKMFTRSAITLSATLSAAVLLGLTSVALASHSRHHHAAPGYGLDIRGDAGIHNVKPFTEEERELFDRATRPGNAP